MELKNKETPGFNIPDVEYEYEYGNKINRNQFKNVYSSIPTSPDLHYRNNLHDTVESDKMEISASILPRRYLVCIMTFFALFLMCAQRVNLSVAVVVMTLERPVMLNNGTIIQKREFEWTSKEKGYVLSSFFYGYLISEFPSGWLAAHIGGKKMLGMELFLASIFSFMIPFIARYGSSAIFVFRALVGILEGGTVPSIYAILSKWAPAEEKTIMLTATLMGLHVSNAVCIFAYGFIAFYWGWRALFYVPGTFAILWCMLWFTYIKENPNDDIRITRKELELIQKSVAVQSQQKPAVCPWKSLLTSAAVWSAIVGMFCESWLYFLFLSELPSYFNEVWNMDVKESGTLLLFSYGIALILNVLLSMLADYLINRKGYPTTKVRKMFYGTGGIGASLSFALIANSVSSTMAIISVALANCFYSLYFGSIFSAPLDIAPRFASIIMGMMNTAASFSALLAPTITGYIVINQNKDEWRQVFLFGSAVFTTGTVIYLAFGSGDVQPWAVDKKVATNDEIIDGH